MTYPYEDCCPNLADAETVGFSPCDDGWCCIHETRHDATEGPDDADMER